MVSPRRWLRAAAVIGATAMLWRPAVPGSSAFSSPTASRRRPGIRCRAVDTHASGRPADQLRDWARATVGGDWKSRSSRSRPTPMPPGSPRSRTRSATSRGPRWQASARSRAITAPTAARRLAPNGDVSPPIRGVRLDGSGGTLRIVDTEECRHRRGRCDASDGADAVHPGDVATVRCRRSQRRRASAPTTSTTPRSRPRVICVGAERISATPRGWITALRAYNNSGVYARAVRDWATAYAEGHPL